MTGEFQGIQYRQSPDDPAAFFFVPGNPSPELMPSGGPAASMIGNESTGMLQLGVHWDVNAEQMRALQEHLQHRFSELSSPPQLRMEALTVDAVKLALTMPDGSSTTLASASSSGYMPFTALFNVMLEGSRYTQTRLAMTGRRQVLKVSYEVSGQSHLLCTATLSGDVRPDLEQLNSSADMEACHAQIDSALGGGRIQLAVTGNDVSESLRTRTIGAAKEQAANLLQRMITGSDASLDAAHLYASVTLSEEAPVKLVREADVGGWFTGSNAANFIVSPAATQAPGGQVNRSFKLGFDPKDFPIAFVQVSCGSSQAAFQPPAFSPVTLTLEAGKPVKVKTNYTDGGPAYQSQVEAATEPLILDPQHLGFCPVSFDGTARKQSGAQRMKIQAKYHPERNGSEDEHAITWGYGDWIEIWYVVSRDSGLAGVIEYRWQETASDGTVSESSAIRTSATQLKL